jgi:hypothetical protein
MAPSQVWLSLYIWIIWKNPLDAWYGSYFIDLCVPDLWYEYLVDSNILVRIWTRCLCAIGWRQKTIRRRRQSMRSLAGRADGQCSYWSSGRSTRIGAFYQTQMLIGRSDLDNCSEKHHAIRSGINKYAKVVFGMIRLRSPERNKLLNKAPNFYLIALVPGVQDLLLADCESSNVELFNYRNIESCCIVFSNRVPVEIILTFLL